LFFVNHGSRHGKFDYIQLVSFLQSEGFEQPQIIRERFMIFIGFIRFDNGYNRVRIDEPRQIVDVTVRIIPRNAITQPQNLLDTVIITQISLYLGTIQHWIPVWVQQTACRSQ